MFEAKSIFIGFILMLKKYTIININIYTDIEDEDYQNGIIALPILGLAIGFFASFISSFKIFYDGFFVSAATLTYYCIITKTVNLRDTYKTLNYIIKPKNQSEEISGIIGIIIICLFYFSLMRIINVTAILLMPVAGFSGLIILSTVFERDKSGTKIIKYCDKYQVLVAFIISFALAVLINYKLVIPLSLTYMIAGIVVNILDKKIELIPNSVEGFIIEITQIIFLIFTYIFKIT